MPQKAEPSRITITMGDVMLIKGMLKRGDRQHDIAAYFGINGGRIGEISTGQAWADIKPARAHQLPPPGPYLTGQEVRKTEAALESARESIERALRTIRKVSRDK